MYTYKYPHPAVTSDCIVLAKADAGQLSILLIRRKHEPCKGEWAFPGGFMNIDETAEDAAVRELAEETGVVIDSKQLRQVGAYTEVDRDPRERVITIAHVVVLDEMPAARGADDADSAQWFLVGHLPPLAFDHGRTLADALRIVNDCRKDVQ